MGLSWNFQRLELDIVTKKKYEPTKFQAGILVWIFSVTATNFTQACHFLTETEQYILL